MEDLLRFAAAIWKAVGCGSALRLIGGLAVRSYVGRHARVTADVDLVSMDEATWSGVRHHLESEGYNVHEHGSWLRAQAASRPVVDLARNPVVDFRTFDAMSMHRAPRAILVEDMEISVVGVEDLASMKLMAHRAQDLIDLTLLAAAEPVNAQEVQRGAELDDIERTLASGAIIARHALRSGALDDAFSEAMGRALGEAEREAFARFLEELEAKGI